MKKHRLYYDEEHDDTYTDEDLEEQEEIEGDDEPAPAWTEEYLNTLGMSMRDFF